MREVCTVIAALWLAVVVSRATESPPGRCCPSRFEVDPNPNDYHFRCEVANLTDGCDNLTMTEDVPNTAINTDEGVTQCSSSYLMTDPNWQDLQTFQPNVACAYYLPPLKGCCWELWLVKYLDPIVCGDNCQCDCEDNVCFEEVGNQFPNEKTYCDLDGGTPTAGWCGTPVGPHNVLGTLPFFTAANTGVLTTFRSDDTNGVGEGALVFGYAVPCAKKRSVRQLPLPSAWSSSLKRTDICQTEYFVCNNRTCNISRECYNYIKIVHYLSRTLYAIFTDTDKKAAEKNYDSRYVVLRRAARLAIYNVKTFGKLVPTSTQLQKHALEDSTSSSANYMAEHHTTQPTVSPTPLPRPQPKPTQTKIATRQQ